MLPVQHSRQRRTKRTFATLTTSEEPSVQALVSSLQSSIDAISSPEYKVWIERYLRHESPCRGAKTPAIRSAVKQWNKDNDILKISRTDTLKSKQLIHALFSTGVNEDAVAATFYICDILQQHNLFPLSRLSEIEQLFELDAIKPWNVVDCFSIHVLPRMIEQNGDDALESICSWRNADNVWQARASIVALLKFIRQDTHMDRAWQNCEVVIKRDERWSKTAVGWCMREIARRDESTMKRFVKEYASHFSIEAVKNATKWCDDADKSDLLEAVKQTQRK